MFCYMFTPEPSSISLLEVVGAGGGGRFFVHSAEGSGKIFPGMRRGIGCLLVLYLVF